MFLDPTLAVAAQGQYTMGRRIDFDSGWPLSCAFYAPIVPTCQCRRLRMRAPAVPGDGAMMTKRLYVGNLGSQMSAQDLETIFQPHGTVVSVEVVADRATGVSKGFAFVEMADEQQANAASAALTGTTHSGRTLTVSPARPRTGGTNTEGGRPGRR